MDPVLGTPAHRDAGAMADWRSGSQEPGLAPGRGRLQPEQCRFRVPETEMRREQVPLFPEAWMGNRKGLPGRLEPAARGRSAGRSFPCVESETGGNSPPGGRSRGGSGVPFCFLRRESEPGWNARPGFPARRQRGSTPGWSPAVNGTRFGKQDGTVWHTLPPLAGGTVPKCFRNRPHDRRRPASPLVRCSSSPAACTDTRSSVRDRKPARTRCSCIAARGRRP